jgi:hypothetical protein
MNLPNSGVPFEASNNFQPVSHAIHGRNRLCDIACAAKKHGFFGPRECVLMRFEVRMVV